MNKFKYLLFLVPVAAVLLFSSFNYNQNTATTAITKKSTKEDLVWHTNVKEAIDLAKKEDKPLFLFFTGSDWCGWCIRLQKEVFKTPEFEAWAKEKVVLVELDFPRRTEQTTELKDQNNQLQQAFAVQGFPTVWFAKGTNKSGKINFEQLGSTGYVAGGPSTWLSGADQIIAKFVHDSKKESAAKRLKPKK
ncbi:thioredoxin [Flavobacterium psychrophilum]|uniref:thioredoxin family protein n=1 Tax=Flavobacterium psychrophilum TaxID=96345 RepID=UPI000B7C3542|nr:thioredoxin fold domain-containing protein [Flavobacterium psychrophilum]GEJ33980.1 thioredoxin [Flavobacterium psychrophilum]GEJ49313.1 thioredoxin [Flavobacterium psychrophilum]SNB04775.1 Thioredoxin family protein [Flavobacterium psychrophilum]